LGGGCFLRVAFRLPLSMAAGRETTCTVPVTVSSNTISKRKKKELSSSTLAQAVMNVGLWNSAKCFFLRIGTLQNVFFSNSLLKYNLLGVTVP
jgi:hypothetical protein